MEAGGNAPRSDALGAGGGVAVPGQASTGVGLPSDWQADALRRLGWLGGAGTTIGALGVVMSFFRQPNLGVRAGTERPLWPLFAGLAISAAMLAATRVAKEAQRARVLDLGLAYLVALSLLANVYRHALPYADSDVVRGVSPTVPAMLVLAIFVPPTPARMAIAATLAALTDPLGLAIAIAAGAPMPPWNLWLWLMSPTLLTIPLAVAAAALVSQLGRTVRRLREMGSYRLVEKLGAGGMGEVWRGEHRSLRRPAAIKLVKPEMLGGTDEASRARVQARFAREAQTTASLTSPHVVEVYDFGVAQDGSLYYVMELVDGLDLETLLRASGALPPERVAFLVRQLLLALRDAHDRGLVHRDVKPANILVGARGGLDDFVKLVDFGLVRPVTTPDSDEAQLTQAGAITGTPGYLAPEAAAGKEIDARADLYAVGCVAYRALAGREVFLSTNVYGLVLQHATSEPEPIASVAPQPVPEALAAIVHRALAKDVAARWSSAAEMIDALDATGLAAEWTPARAREAAEALGDPRRVSAGVAATELGA